MAIQELRPNTQRGDAPDRMPPRQDWMQKVVAQDLSTRFTKEFVVERALPSCGAHAAVEQFSCDEEVDLDMTGEAGFVTLALDASPRRSFWRSAFWKGEREAQMVAFAPPGLEFSTRNLPNNQRVLSLMISPETFSSVLEDDALSGGYSPCPEVRSARLRQLLEMISTELLSPGMASDILTHSLVVAVTVELNRYFSNEEEHLDGYSSTRIRKVIDYIEGYLDQEISVLDIAKACGISARHLSRLFRSATGTTLVRYVSARRLERAKTLLRQPDGRPKNVSGLCGFRDHAAFSTAFRKAMGISPREFRRQAGFRA
jgi:AraC family transcriptional regulator